MFMSTDTFQTDFVNSQPGTQPQPEPLSQSLLLRVFDEIDYGLILATADGCVQHANHLARYELARALYLKVDDSYNGAAKGQLQASSAAATVELLRSVRDAARGRRQMLTLRHESEILSLSCVPLFHPFEGGSATVLLMLGRQNDTPNLALSFFARSYKLSNAEEGVLRALCNGQQISDIAATNDVAESTVRAQIRSLRDKTQCNSIRLLVQLVAALPPVVPVRLTVQNTPD